MDDDGHGVGSEARVSGESVEDDEPGEHISRKGLVVASSKLIQV